MTEVPPLRPHFEAIMTAVYEHARLAQAKDSEGCGRQFRVIQEAFADFAFAARSEAFEEAARIADGFDHADNDGYSTAIAIAAAIRERVKLDQTTVTTTTTSQQGSHTPGYE